MSLYTWGSTKVFVEALSRMKGPVTTDELQKALYSLKNYQTGVVAPVSYSAQRHLGTSALYPAEVAGGKWKMGAPIDINAPK